jgi:ribonuclease HII
VTRDRKMRRLALKYPMYSFDIHKGYGTEKHYLAIGKNGLCPEHRRTFLVGR